MGRSTGILGIVNITRDSFSDGGLFLDAEAAVAHARQLVASGAFAVDLGPASSHPDADKVAPDEEIRRLKPVIEALQSDGIKVSIDSFQPQTQLFGIASGVDYLNDIEGFSHQEIYDRLAASSVKLIVMHSIQRRGIATRVDVDADTIVDTVSSFFDQRIRALTDAGVAAGRLILDPGMGFFLGKKLEPSRNILRSIPQLKRRFGLPLLVSVSRKSFLRSMTGTPLEAISAATLSAEIFAYLQGVDFIRTHDVEALNDALRVMEALS